MQIEELGKWLKAKGKKLIEMLLRGDYKPEAIRRIAIIKPGGGKRWLGIPTVLDRLIQQAVLQVLQQKIDPYFDENSYGYRPRRSRALPKLNILVQSYE